MQVTQVFRITNYSIEATVEFGACEGLSEYINMRVDYEMARYSRLRVSCPPPGMYGGDCTHYREVWISV